MEIRLYHSPAENPPKSTHPTEIKSPRVGEPAEPGHAEVPAAAASSISSPAPLPCTQHTPGTVP